MADDRKAFRGQLRDRVEAGRAIKGVAALDHRGMRGPEVILVGAELAVEQTDLDETIAGGLAHRRRPDGIDDRENVDSRRRGRSRLVGRVDEQHGKLTLAFQGAQIGDGQSIVFHGACLSSISLPVAARASIAMPS